MRIRRVVLDEFRSYERLDLHLDAGITALVGANGAGKTNVVEAIQLVARGESSRASDDAEMVRWSAPVGRAGVEISRAEATDELIEVVLIAPGAGERRKPRRWLVGGAAKRAEDAVGRLAIVGFYPEDVLLMAEAPAARRRYLDAMVAQADRRHRLETREYQKVLEQRNALLRALRESGRPAAEARRNGELAFWNESLVRVGASITERRMRAVAELREPFRRAGEAVRAGPRLDLSYSGQVGETDLAGLMRGYTELIEAKGEREIWQGATLVGPQREDVRVTGDGRELPSFASRGEHRSAVLALKLAEAEWLTARIGERPVLLLDDVLSELDPVRRASLVQALPEDAQVIVTAALPVGLPPILLQRGRVRQVTPGVVE